MPPKLQAILVKALAPNPEDRYATAEEMLKDIDSVGDLSAFKEKAEGTNRAYFRQAPWNEKWKVLRTIISADAERTFLRDHLGEDEAGLKKNPSYPALMRALRNLQAIIVAGFLLGFFLAVAAALHFVHPSDEIQRLWLTLVVSGAGLGIGGLSALAADVKAHSFLNRRAYRRVMEQLTKLVVGPKDEGRRRLLLDSMRVGRRVKAADRQWLEDHGIHWDMLTAETPPKRELPIEDQLEKQTTALETNPGDRDAAAAIPGLLLNLMGPLVRVSESQAKPQNLETYQRILSMTAERNIDQLALSYFLLRDTNTRRGFLDVLTEGKDHPVLATLLWAHEHPFAEWGKAKAPAAGLDRNTLETLAAFHVLDAQLSEDLPSGGVRAINVTALLKSANAPASVREAVQALAALADARVALGWETRGQTVLTANAPADDPEALALGSRFNNLRMVTGVSDSSGRKIGHELLVKNVKTFKPDLASLELLTPNPAADVDATAADLPGVHFVASALRLSDLVQRALRALAVALASA